MCGIVGVAGYISAREKKAFEDMLVFSQVRGSHSTGVASVTNDKTGNTYMCKTIGRPHEMMDYDKRYDKVVDFNRKFILGHNRFATTGKVSLKNAHPFNFGNILGCHNGTIPEYRLKDLQKGPDDYGTDSETVLANINEFDLKSVFHSLTGAWAFVWHDRRDNSLNFLRNHERDLFYCYTKDRRTIFWASEAGFLKTALARNELEIGELFDVTPGFHHSWEIKGEYNKEFTKPQKVLIPSGQFVSQSGNRFPGVNEVGEGQSGTGGNPQSSHQARMHQQRVGGVQYNITDIRTGKPFKNGVQNGVWDANTRQFIGAPNGAVAEVLRMANKQDEVADFTSFAQLKDFDGQGYLTKRGDKKVYRGYRGTSLSQKEWEDATKSGCRWCDATAVWGRPVRFISHDQHICLSCNSDEEVRHIANAG